MLKEFLDSLRESVRERITNPLVGSYIVFLILVNWRMIMIVFFGEVELDQRLELIDRYPHSFEYSFGIPALLALGYVFVMPWLTVGVRTWQAGPIARSKTRLLKSEIALSADRTKLASLQSKIMIEKKIPEWEDRQRLREEDRRDREVDRANDRKDKEAEFTHEERLQSERLRSESGKDNTVSSLEKQSLKREIGTLDIKIERLEREMEIYRKENSKLSAETESQKREIQRLEKSLSSKS